MTSSKQILVIANPNARIGAARAIAALERHVTPDSELQIVYLKRTEPLLETVGSRIESADLVVAVGGDGTVSESAAVIDSRPLPLGIMPGGSTNMVAKVSDIPLDPDAAAKLIFGPHRLEMIDVGVAGGRHLIHAGGAGFDARIFNNASPQLKQRLGWLAYLPSAMLSVNSPASHIEMTIDGEEISAVSRFVLICNSASLVFSGFTIVPDSGRKDGLLDILAFTANDPVAIGGTLTDFVLKGLHHSSRVIYRRGADLRLEAHPPMPVEIDGDLAGSTPLHLIVRPKSLALIVPL